jgi:NADPH:quinone reductase-like Zn-dependent oxidoreductase
MIQKLALKSLLSSSIIDMVHPIEQAGQAHQHMAANKNIGKIILKVARD